MVIIAIVLGLVLGLIVSEGRFDGAVFGALLGWLVARTRAQAAALAELRHRLDMRERTQTVLAARQAAATSVEAGSAAPSHPPAPALGQAEDALAAVAEATAEPEPPPQPAPETPSAAAEPPTRPQAWVIVPPSGPSLFDAALGHAKRWFSEGNVPVKIGMVVLFFGVAAALKFAADQGLFALPVEFWLIAIGAAACAALLFAWRRRDSHRLFSLSLQGGALGVLLIDVFASFRLFEAIPAGFAFALVLALVAGSALLAVLQNAMVLAVLGSIGGFLAPVLISTGTGNHIALFSYYAVLNAAIFAIAWIRPWRVLNLVGFAFTFAIGTLWGWRYYRPEHFASVEPFLILFFLFYVAIAVLYALRQPQARRGPSTELRTGLVDGSLVFGVPLLAFPLQVALLEGEPMPLAFSALAMATLYAGLAAVLIRREGLATLGLSFAALAVGFATLAVPLALDAQWTASTWALEGAALVWLGLRQESRLQIAAGIALQVLAGSAWLIHVSGEPDTRPLVDGATFAGLLLALSAWFSARVFERGERHPMLAWLAFGAGALWWGLLTLRTIAWFDTRDAPAATAIALGLTAVLAMLARRRLAWARIGLVAIAALMLSPLAVLPVVDQPTLSGSGRWSWPLWLAAALFCLHGLREPPWQRGLSWAHVAVLAALALLAGNELYQRLDQPDTLGGAWAMAGAILPAALLLWGSWRQHWARWPLGAAFPYYAIRWWLPAGVALGLWWWLSLFHPGDAVPLPFLPLFNPLELVEVAVLLLLAMLLHERARGTPQLGRYVLALGGWLLLSVAALRGVHHLGGLPWEARLLFERVSQATLTIVWSVLGVGAWIIGSRRGSRSLWLAGAVVMGVVLAKLVLIDRQFMGNLAGIVSFLAVGLLLTIVGYFAPSPPRREAEGGA